ncbi:MAG: hypothetical protein M3P95_00955 [Actinomycetota bacterium]|nr:hypothetical protein [Actinomycetota bacterium]
MSQTHSEQEDGRAGRRDVVLLELEQARSRRRARHLTLRLPHRLPLPTQTARPTKAG